MRSIKQFIWSILNSLKIGGPTQLLLNGALTDDGWYKSFHSKQSIDRNGNPIPWCTYPFIKFIEPRLKKEFDVFEFGCGNSTRWYAPKVHSIKSVEHSLNWFTSMEKMLPANAILVHRELTENGAYSKEVLAATINYHLVIIDGEDRNNCLVHAISKLTNDGIIIFDNSDRKEYESSFSLLKKSGFKRIDFSGLAPIVNVNSCTTIFYRDENCLGI